MTEARNLQTLKEMDWGTLTAGPFQPSPAAWEDEVFYFLMLDRFSDGNEAGCRDGEGEIIEGGTTPLFDAGKDADSAVRTDEDAAAWREAGSRWQGGNLRGLTTKIGYLKRLGISALWISPVLKQAAHADDSYHGYGTQNFLAVDPHFGTADDLRAAVTAAHELGISAILDVILNHSADVFAYAGDGDLTYRPEPYPVAGFRDKDGKPTMPFESVDSAEFPDAFPDGAIWPRELQTPAAFTRKGRIEQWDADPEFREGDFFDFKDLYLGEGGVDDYRPSDALRALTDCYKYWIAFADLDGFRLDTVKHMDAGAVKFFCEEIRTFAESLGKRNFLIVGEIVGDRADMCGALLCSGLSAALGLDEIPRLIRRILRGETDPCEYFRQFANSRREGEKHPDPIWWRDRVVTFFDDHDQVGKNIKGRLASEFPDRDAARAGVLRAVAFQVLTLGTPCLYYGTEQAMDGHALGEEGISPGGVSPDRYIREALFGGTFGPFRSAGRHIFDEENPLYQEMAKLLTLRAAHPALRRGRQYLREISADGEMFWTPLPGENPYRGPIAWSRLLDVDEFVCAVNTDTENPHDFWVTTDETRHGPGADGLKYLYSTDAAQIGTQTNPPEARNGGAVRITVPAGGVVVLR